MSKINNENIGRNNFFQESEKPESYELARILKLILTQLLGENHEILRYIEKLKTSKHTSTLWSFRAGSYIVIIKPQKIIEIASVLNSEDGERKLHTDDLCIRINKLVNNNPQVEVQLELRESSILVKIEEELQFKTINFTDGGQLYTNLLKIHRPKQEN